jgi:hypothetical protein
VVAAATRPRILKRAGGQFEGDIYLGGAHCERCGIADVPIVSVWTRSELDIAHLDGVPGHDDDENLAALCRPCHRAHDLAEWAAKFGAWLVSERATERATVLDKILEWPEVG